MEEHEHADENTIKQHIKSLLTQNTLTKKSLAGFNIMRTFEKNVMLQVLDSHWKDHLAAMDYLRQRIHLRGLLKKTQSKSIRERLLSTSLRCYLKLCETLLVYY